jgi:hypothetical protein
MSRARSVSQEARACLSTSTSLTAPTLRAESRATSCRLGFFCSLAAGRSSRARPARRNHAAPRRLKGTWVLPHFGRHSTNHRYFRRQPNARLHRGAIGCGAAAAIMGSAYPYLYAAICVGKDLPSAFFAMRHGGPPLPATRPLLPTIVFHGDCDNTVSPFERRPNHRAVKGGKFHQTISGGPSASGIRYTRTVHADESDSPVLEQ